MTVEPDLGARAVLAGRQRARGSRVVWRVVLIVGIAQLGFATVLPLLPLYLTERLGASVKLVGLVIATFALVETFFKTAWGGLADRVGRRPVMAAGLLLSALAPALMSLLRVPVLFVPLRLLDGAGSAAVWPPAAAAIGDHAQPSRRAEAMGLLNVAFLGGIAFGPSLGLFVAGFTGDVRAGFYTASGLLVVAAVLALWLLPPAAPPHTAPAVRSGTGSVLPADPPPARPQAVLDAFCSAPGLLGLYLIAFAQMFAAGMLIPIAAIYAKQVVGLREEAIGAIFLLVTASVAAATVPAGRLADRAGRPALVQLGMVCGALGMWLIPATNRLPGLIAAAILLGGSYALAFPAWLALVTEHAPPGRLGLAIGASETVQGLGIVLGPLVGGVLWDAAGPRAPFVASAIALTAGAAYAARVLR